MFQYPEVIQTNVNQELSQTLLITIPYLLAFRDANTQVKRRVISNYLGCSNNN